MAGAGQSAVPTHRRPLATAAAAGTVMIALCFVPDAKATPDAAVRDTPSPAHSASASAEDGRLVEESTAGGTAPEPRLARTGGVDPGPYVLGGLGFLGAGGVLLVRSLRRSTR